MAGSFARRLRARLLAGIAIAAVLTADASGQVSTTYYYDALGRVIAAANSDGKAVGYRYDAAGNRIQVTNTVPFDEIIPTAFTSSTNTPGDGLTTPGAMRDGAYAAAATIHGTNGAANEFITADFGTLKSVDHVDIAPANFAPWTVANTNGAQLQWSTDNVTWTPAATTGGAVLNQYLTVRMGGVIARYVRLFQPAATRLAVGDFRFYGHAASGNQPPVADSFTVTLPAGGGAIDLTSHIHDADLDALSINGFNSPTAAAHGTVTQASSTSFTYTPATGATGDTFSYKITDGHNNFATGLITVAISVPVNHPPVAVSETIGTIPNFQITFDPKQNDSDPDPSDTITIVSATVDHAVNIGSIQINADNTLTFTPGVSFSGNSAFTYTIQDSHGATASVTDPVTVQYGAGPNHLPVAHLDSVSTPIGTPVTFDPRLNDTDDDHDPLTIQSATQGQGGGHVVVNGGTSVTFTPVAGAQPGSADQFTYTISDGRGGTSTATAFVSIQTTPDRPPVANDDFVSITSGDTLTINPLTNDSDPDTGDSIGILGIGQPSRGSILGHNGTQIFYQAFVGDSGIGNDSFTYTIQDTNGLTATATVHVTVTNQAPSAFDISTTVANGGSTVINAPQNDPDGQTVTFVSIATPSRGTIQISADRLSATYTSTAGLPGGTDTFQYVVRDTLNAQSSANIIVQISPPTQLGVNADAPGYDALLNTLGGSNFPPPVGVTVTNGSGSYDYEWRIVPGGDLTVVPTAPSSQATQFTSNDQTHTNIYTAQYYCHVTDRVTGHTGDSQPINVSIDVETGA